MTDLERETPLRPRFLLLTGLILAAAASRLLPYAVPPDAPLRAYLWNFTPIAAIALFGGACFASRWAAVLVPLAAMLLSDAVLFVTGLAPEGLAGRLVIYGYFLAVVGIGVWLRRRRNLPTIAGTVVASSLLFFLFSNFALWLISPSAPLPASCPENWQDRLRWAFSPDAALISGYPKTFDGLLTCYVMAVPFLRNTLLGDAFYALVLFGGLALAERWFPVLREAPQPAVHPAMV